MTYESVTDKLGRTIKVGDTVAVACLNFKRPTIRVGTVDRLDRIMWVTLTDGERCNLRDGMQRALRIINGKVDGAIALAPSS